MADRLTGKKALVTAAAQGIGRATALAFAAEGAQVLATDINEAKLAELSDRPGITTRQLDVRDDAAVAALAAEAGALDVLCNVAGFVHHGTILDCAAADWDFSFDLNVKSMYLMTRAVLPSMLDNGSGAIVNTSSISAVAGTPMEVLYCTSKGACHMFTRAIATEYRDRGIRCNAVCPGFIRTDHGNRELKELRAYGVDVSEEDISRLQGRICEPEEVATAALFLASGDASFVNGETLFVDNGMLVGT